MDNIRFYSQQDIYNLKSFISLVLGWELYFWEY